MRGPAACGCDHAADTKHAHRTKAKMATFIDFEHFIIPDEITIGGMVVGFFSSFFFPQLHAENTVTGGMLKSVLGMVAGAGVIYFVLRMGKLFFGRQRVALAAEAKIIFSETAVHRSEEHT